MATLDSASPSLAEREALLDRERRAREHATAAATLAARNGWERDFCDSMAEVPRRRRLTEKQLAKLEDIVARMFDGAEAETSLIEEIADE